MQEGTVESYQMFVQRPTVTERWSPSEINIDLPAICMWMAKQGTLADV
jgi:hypothetical protein